MPTCDCGKKFHACSNSNLGYDWEWKYCSEKCYHNSQEYQDNIQRCRDVVNLLDRDMAQKLLFVIDSEDATLDLYALLRDKVLGHNVKGKDN